jgi:NADPH-dependent curcumin reductase CurA
LHIAYTQYRTNQIKNHFTIIIKSYIQRNSFNFISTRLYMVVKKVSRQICLAEYPVGMPTDNNFKLVQVDIPEPTKEGEFLVRNIWMSVDPYMRGRMRKEGGGNSYIPPFRLAQPLEGACIGQVIASKNNQFAVGEYVLGMYGWREYWLSNGLMLLRSIKR